MDPADCIHANTSLSYTVDGAAATLIVEACGGCGEKTSSTLISKKR